MWRASLQSASCSRVAIKPGISLLIFLSLDSYGLVKVNELELQPIYISVVLVTITYLIGALLLFISIENNLFFNYAPELTEFIEEQDD